MTQILYCKSHHRRPIRLDHSPFLADAQAAIPLCWCSRCGSEVFVQGQDLCPGCRSTKGEIP